MNFAPISWQYDNKGNLIPEQLEGGVKNAYAPEGYRYNSQGYLVRTKKPRWMEKELKEVRKCNE